MKTTIDIPNKLMDDAIFLSGCHTKREVVVSALEEYNQKRRMTQISKSFGKCDQWMTLNDLKKSREEK